MTAKEYLNRLIEQDDAINNKQQRLATLRDVAFNTTSQCDGEAVQRTREKNPLENIIAKIIDLDRELDEDIDKLVDLKAEVWEQLDRLSDERYKRILWLHYAERKTWGYIANDVNLTRRHVIRLHKVALDSFNNILEI